MTVPDCPHRPPCLLPADRARCDWRSRTEAAVAKGRITRESGLRLLRLYGLPMTPASKVWRPEADETQRELL